MYIHIVYTSMYTLNTCVNIYSFMYPRHSTHIHIACAMYLVCVRSMCARTRHALCADVCTRMCLSTGQRCGRSKCVRSKGHIV